MNTVCLLTGYRGIRAGILFLLLLIAHFAPPYIDSVAAEDRGKLLFLDLQSVANQKLVGSLHGFDGNDFAELPQGDQVFAATSFKIGESYICLGSKIENDRPKLIEGIQVGQKIRRLKILHGTGYGGYGGEGSPMFERDGVQIGEYRINYADGTVGKVPIVYGDDVRDWWTWGGRFDVKKGKVAWEGQNAFSRSEKQKIRLYLQAWENPKPEMLVLSIDYASTETSPAAPFCLGITAELAD